MRGCLSVSSFVDYVFFFLLIHCVLTWLFVCRTFYQAAETLSPPDSITKRSLEARQRSALLSVNSNNDYLTCTLGS